MIIEVFVDVEGQAMLMLAMLLQFFQHFESRVARLEVAQVNVPVVVLLPAMFLQIVELLEPSVAADEVARKHRKVFHVRSSVCREESSECELFVAMAAHEFSLLLDVNRLLMAPQVVDVLEGKSAKLLHALERTILDGFT